MSATEQQVGLVDDPEPTVPPHGGTVSRAVAAPPLLLAAALVAGVLLPIAVSAATGSLSIPHNDAWAYSRAAQLFAHTGHLDLFNWGRMSLVGLLVVLGPLGKSITAQNLFSAATAVVALASVYSLSCAKLSRTKAAAVTLVVALWPGFGLLSTSFMTDMPAFAAAVACLALAERAHRRGQVGYLAAAVVVGFWGVTIREQDAAAPVAALAAAAITAFRARRAGSAAGAAGAEANGVSTRMSAQAPVPPSAQEPTQESVQGSAAVPAGSVSAANGRADAGPASAVRATSGPAETGSAAAPVVALRWVLLLSAVLIVAVGAFELWRRTLPGTESLPSSLVPNLATNALTTVAQCVLILTFAISPIVLWTARPLRWGPWAWAAAVAAFALAAAFVKHNGIDNSFPGNYVTRDGAYPEAVYPDPPAILSHTVWELVLGLACLSCALLVGSLANRGSLTAVYRALGPLHLFYILIAAGGIVAPAESTGQSAYDRYVLVIAPQIAIAAFAAFDAGRGRPAADPRRARIWTSARWTALAAAAVVLVSTTAVIEGETLALDQALWNGAQTLVDKQLATPTQIDAGFDWMGYHSPSGSDRGQPTQQFDPLTGLFPGYHLCYVVAAHSEQHPGWTLVSTHAYHAYGLFGRRLIYTYSVQGTCAS